MEEIRQGYKQTDIGVIPEDWEIAELGEISKYQGGSQPDISFFSTRKYNGFIRLIQIRDYKTDKYTVYIPEGLARRKCNKDDIMIGRYGPPIFQILKGLEGAYNVALIKAIPNVTLDKSFYYHTLKREDLFQLIELLSRRSSGQTGVDLVGLKSFKIGLPPKEEQTAIATALSDTDALIAALEKKIAKKQQIKQGAMQQLLTGKMRLPGFSGEWVEKKLGEIGKINMGQSPSSQFYNTERRGLPLIQGNADIDKRQTIIRIFTTQVTKKCDIGDTILSVRAPVGAVAKSTITACIGRGVCAIKSDNDFLFHYLIYVENDWGKYSKGSTFDSISSNELYDVILSIPVSEIEQTAIAQILTDMDNEIAQLEKERDKYNDLKAGMMQVLLTGKVRLV